ncbi:hypothetical protein K505DRAFT_338304 [Melanomma pulvis-pyrius CBS 109.77]|uniref:Uncharacterized protein n=1 Tax=Melanomma pulvis-pyrius CBS 109.77 TaxID=1314802 RepID=A0A6A6X931_9PLEO|nr:hypothetical protein K505DRAFT_338304 [Melanomma pulvis-pyrius CBS 109.77]
MLSNWFSSRFSPRRLTLAQTSSCRGSSRKILRGIPRWQTNIEEEVVKVEKEVRNEQRHKEEEPRHTECKRNRKAMEGAFRCKGLESGTQEETWRTTAKGRGRATILSGMTNWCVLIANRGTFIMHTGDKRPMDKPQCIGSKENEKIYLSGDMGSISLAKHDCHYT